MPSLYILLSTFSFQILKKVFICLTYVLFQQSLQYLIRIKQMLERLFFRSILGTNLICAAGIHSVLTDSAGFLLARLTCTQVIPCMSTVSTRWKLVLFFSTFLISPSILLEKLAPHDLDKRTVWLGEELTRWPSSKSQWTELIQLVTGHQ